MGFYEFGQSLTAMVIVVVVMLVAFGGFNNQTLVGDYLPANGSLNNPNDINNSLNTSTATLEGTPYAKTTGTSNNNTDPFQNLSFGFLTQFYNLVLNFPSAALDALTYVGLPSPIVYVLGSFMFIFGGIFLLFLLANVGGALFGRGGNA